MKVVDDVLDMTPENLERVLNEMLAGSRTSAIFELRVTQEMRRSSAPVRGAFIQLADRILGRQREPVTA